MNKDELWAIYAAKNPKFNDPDAEITLKASGIKKLFEQTWDMAHEQGMANGHVLEQEAPSTKPYHPFFGRMFGR